MNDPGKELQQIQTGLEANRNKPSSQSGKSNASQQTPLEDERVEKTSHSRFTGLEAEQTVRSNRKVACLAANPNKGPTSLQTELGPTSPEDERFEKGATAPSNRGCAPF